MNFTNVLSVLTGYNKLKGSDESLEIAVSLQWPYIGVCIWEQYMVGGLYLLVTVCRFY
jgi:hypothetical protein